MNQNQLEDKARALEILLHQLLNKVNLVTSQFRHRKSVIPGALAQLCDRQIYVETMLKQITENSCKQLQESSPETPSSSATVTKSG